MKIKSAIKDYYDYVAHNYGGGDPTVLYNRNRMFPMKYTGCGNECFEQTKKFGLIERSIPKTDLRKEDNVRRMWLFVAGKLFVIQIDVDIHHQLSDGSQYSILSDERFGSPWRIVNHPIKAFRRWYEKEVPVARNDYTPGMDAGEHINAVAKEINSPVFVFSEHGEVYPKVPLLGELGLGSTMSAEQCYQEIAMFIANVIKDNPDLTITSKLSDTEKVLSHGFDKKQSFRHRK